MIGRRLVPVLIADGHTVIASVRKMSPNMPHVHKLIVGDLFDEAVRNKLMRGLHGAAGQSVVIHLAGMNGVSACHSNPSSAIQSNTFLTAFLVESAVACGVKRFFFASSGLVYGSFSGLNPIEESLCPAPKSVYAASKLAAETMIQGYSIGRDISCEILRFSNVYGPESPSDSVVGTIISQLREGENVKTKSFDSVRDFIFIDDVIEAFRKLLLVKYQRGCTVTNISYGTGINIGQLVHHALRAAGLPPKNGSDVPSDISSDDQLVLSNTLLKSRTGWQPQYNIASGLRQCFAEKSAAECV